MKKWEKEIAKGLANFRRQDGSTMEIQIVPASRLAAAMQTANRGDEKARVLVKSLLHFFAMADAAAADGVGPACGCCGVKLGHGDVCGFAVLLPLEEKEGTGLVAAYCERCIERDCDDLIREFSAMLEQEIGGALVSMQ